MFARFENATSLDVRLAYIAIITPMGILGSRHQELGMYIEEAYREFEAAGRPQVKLPSPVGVETCLKWGSYIPRLMRGDVDDPEVAFRLECRTDDILPGSYEDGWACFGFARIAEGSWEPQNSARVSAWHRKKIDWTIQHKGSKHIQVPAGLDQTAVSRF